MFTGIVRELGSLTADPEDSGQGGVRLRIGHSAELGAELPTGASLAVAGVCLTVVAGPGGRSAVESEVELSRETLARTRLGSLRLGDRVNLEPALRVGDPLGGHWLQGHVDTLARLLRRDDREAHSEFTVAIPRGMAAYVVEKGSVALDGVSLTVAACDSRKLHGRAHSAHPGGDDARRRPARESLSLRSRRARQVRRTHAPPARSRAGRRLGRGAQLTWREVVPLPSRFWIRHLPRRWPEAEEPRLDLFEHRIVWPPAPGQRQPAGERLPALAALADLALVPPVRQDLARERANLIVDLVAARVPVLDQCSSADDASAVPGALLAVDLLSALLERNLAAIDDFPEQAWVVLPLLPVLSNSPASWAEVLRRVAARQPLAVVGVAPELSPLDRRRLVDRLGEEHFEAFHHAPPDGASDRRLERAFAAAVARAGLPAFAARPPAPLPPRLARNRALATLLAECGELWLRVGRSEADAAALLAAARHFESAAVAGLDLAALSREGNLAHLGFLSPLALAVVDSAARHSTATPPVALLVELRAEYAAGEAGSS